jgi:hypothetical protein
MYDKIKNTKLKDMMSKKVVDDILIEYGVKNEDELATKLYAEAQTIPCIKCKKETSYENLIFVNSDPICLECAGEKQDDI